jgi:hypothetical protein
MQGTQAGQVHQSEQACNSEIPRNAPVSQHILPDASRRKDIDDAHPEQDRPKRKGNAKKYSAGAQSCDSKQEQRGEYDGCCLDQDGDTEKQGSYQPVRWVVALLVADDGDEKQNDAQGNEPVEISMLAGKQYARRVEADSPEHNLPRGSARHQCLKKDIQRHDQSQVNNDQEAQQASDKGQARHSAGFLKEINDLHPERWPVQERCYGVRIGAFLQRFPDAYPRVDVHRFRQSRSCSQEKHSHTKSSQLRVPEISLSPKLSDPAWNSDLCLSRSLVRDIHIPATHGFPFVPTVVGAWIRTHD